MQSDLVDTTRAEAGQDKIQIIQKARCSLPPHPSQFVRSANKAPPRTVVRRMLSARPGQTIQG